MIINLIEKLNKVYSDRIVKIDTFGSDNTIHYVLLSNKEIICFGAIDAGTVPANSYKVALTPVFPFSFNIITLLCSFTSGSGLRTTNHHEPQVRGSHSFLSSQDQLQFVVTSGANTGSASYENCFVEYMIIGSLTDENYNSLIG